MSCVAPTEGGLPEGTVVPRGRGAGTSQPSDLFLPGALGSLAASPPVKTFTACRQSGVPIGLKAKVTQVAGWVSPRLANMKVISLGSSGHHLIIHPGMSGCRSGFKVQPRPVSQDSASDEDILIGCLATPLPATTGDGLQHKVATVRAPTSLRESIFRLLELFAGMTVPRPPGGREGADRIAARAFGRSDQPAISFLSGRCSLGAIRPPSNLARELL